VGSAADRSLKRLVLSMAVGFSICVLLAPPAPAGLLPTCNVPVSQPFRQWGDDAWYSLVPGGSFEAGSVSWALSGGARVVHGNETFYVRSSSDRRSLLLPAGSSATTPPTCFTLADWHLRFFLVNTGAESGRVRVTVVVRNLLGVLSVLDGGTASAGGEWQPSPRIGLLASNLTSPLFSSISFRFTPIGSGASFQIDDVYLDPWKSS
jgi:hypothetical protein